MTKQKICSRSKCTNPVNQKYEKSEYCEKHKARIGVHRKNFVNNVKQRVMEEYGELVCENLEDCPLYGKVKYEEHWFDVDHKIEVNQFDNSATVKEINHVNNGKLLCKLCHANKNNQLRPRKFSDLRR